MSQERWDIILRFHEGPLAVQGDLVLRGPVVRMGAAPGPGGLALEGYRGLDDRQAVITAYDGGTVTIAPVGINQVRVAPHANIDWKDVQVLQKPAFLSPGCAVHLGPPGRGVTATFVDARRLGEWEQRRILSDASQANPKIQPSNVATLDAGRRIPRWFIPATLVMGLFFTAGITFSIFRDVAANRPDLGPKDEGQAYYERVDIAKVTIDPALKDGINQGFHDFVMKPNSAQARWPALAKPEGWDPTFMQYTLASAKMHLRAWNYWRQLEVIKDDYGYVVEQLRKAGLPEVLAAIPYQESRYTDDAKSPVCAKGYWQFMPEVAHRAGIAVRNCSFRGAPGALYTPTRMTPRIGVLQNAEYVNFDGRKAECKITGCEVDERTDLAASTRGAIELLREAWEDPDISRSGAAVQITILSHNSGYDNSRFDEKRTNYINILPAYKRHLGAKQMERDPHFYGANITCTGAEHADIIVKGNDTCGGVIANQSQHYAYSIVAQHLLAVCYYAQNHADKPAFRPWKDYARRTGYCNTFAVPTQDEVLKKGGTQ
jgi:hypothetical protein